MKHLAAFLALFFTLALPAAAEEPPLCQGTNLLMKMFDEDPKAYAEVLEEAKRVKHGEAILWRISRDGTPDSWLFGTAHVTDPRVTILPAEAMHAFTMADTVALELKEIRSKEELTMATLRHARLMVMPPGQSLWDLIPDAEEPLIRGNPNLPAGAAEAIFGYQPWVVAAMLSIPACEQARDLAGVVSLDEKLAQMAEERGAQLLGLETIEEQLSVFASMPMDLQSKYLMAVARSSPRLADHFETLIALYAARMVTAYLPLAMKVEPADSDSEELLAFVQQDLVVKRNHTMVSRALGLLERGNAFIAVGALHLPGDDGLVELFGKAGYKLTPVN